MTAVPKTQENPSTFLWPFFGIPTLHPYSEAAISDYEKDPLALETQRSIQKALGEYELKKLSNVLQLFDFLLRLVLFDFCP